MGGEGGSLGRELCGRAGVAWSEPPEDDVAATQAFWNETSGVLLLEAAQKLGERFDALVVDEAQDFLTEWWAVLDALLREGDRAPVTLVADPDQDLWQRESRFPEGLPVFPLRTNCRNTSAIAEFLGELTGSHPRVSPWTVRGEEPKVHRWRNAADEREKAGALIAQLLLKDEIGLERVAIVGMRRLENSCLAEKAELAGFPVVPIGDDGTAGVPGALRMQTWHRYGPGGRRGAPPRRGREPLVARAAQPLRRGVARAAATARVREGGGGGAGAGGAHRIRGIAVGPVSAPHFELRAMRR